MRPEVRAAVEQYIDRHGEDVLLQLLTSGVNPQGPASRLAIKHMAEHIKADLPCKILLSFNPRDKNPERHTDVQLLPPRGAIHLEMTG